jgi:hypothetical protein
MLALAMLFSHYHRQDRQLPLGLLVMPFLAFASEIVDRGFQ